MAYNKRSPWSAVSLQPFCLLLCKDLIPFTDSAREKGIHMIGQFNDGKFTEEIRAVVKRGAPMEKV